MSQTPPLNRKPTTERLAEELQRIHAPALMIERALAGYYDDFKSSVATPIIALVQDCRFYAKTNPRLNLIAERAKSGDFDATDWESDEWAKSPEGQEMLKDFRF